MTAPTTTAPASSTAPEGEGAAGVDPGQAPGSGSTGPATAPGSTAGQASEGRQNVRSSSRDDDEPREPGQHDDQQQDAKTGRKTTGDWKIEDLPPGAQKLIGDLRKENGTRRTEAQESKKAADAASKRAGEVDEKFASAVQAFTKALGLTPEADEPQRSPEELIGELTTKYQQSRVELAVFRAAAAAEADAEALLDSRSFLTAAHALDPADQDFEQAIADAISDAVEQNPKLRAQPVEPAYTHAPSGGDFGGGPAISSGPDEWSVDDFRRERRNGRG